MTTLQIASTESGKRVSVSRPPRPTIASLILARQVYVRSGKDSIVNPALSRLLVGMSGQRRARTFLDEASRSAPLLRACEEQGIDIEQWRDALDIAEAEARESVQETRHDAYQWTVQEVRPGVYRWQGGTPS